MSTHPEITQDFVRSVLKYNRHTGTFIWRERADARPQWNGRYAGKGAGYKWTCDNGKNWYLVIRLLDWPFMAHRLAVLYVTGEWPPNDVDHKDLDGLNNRWVNIRHATKTQNGCNRGKSLRNTSGYKGVSLVSGKSDRWRAQIRADGVLHFLGNYDAPEKAHAAYTEAAKKLHGRFARAA